MSEVAVYQTGAADWSLLGNLRRLARHREILFTLALRDLKVRYKQTALGVLWAALPPFMLMVVFSLLFSRLARVPSEGLPYPIFAYSALLPWTFFSSSLTAASNSVIGNAPILSKVYFPREILPWSAVLVAGVDFLVASVMFIALVIFYRTPLTIYALFVVPLLGIQILLTAGIALILAALNVYYRDVRYAMPLLLQVWMYATPILYPVGVIPERVRILYFALNPMGGLVDGYRRVLVRGLPPDALVTALSAISAAVLFVLCYRVFKRLEREFVDVI